MSKIRVANSDDPILDLINMIGNEKGTLIVVTSPLGNIIPLVVPGNQKNKSLEVLNALKEYRESTEINSDYSFEIELKKNLSDNKIDYILLKNYHDEYIHIK